MNELIIAIGLFFVIEGLVYAGFPNGVKRMAEEMKNIPADSLRFFGLCSAIFGLLVIWFVKT